MENRSPLKEVGNVSQTSETSEVLKENVPEMENCPKDAPLKENVKSPSRPVFRTDLGGRKTKENKPRKSILKAFDPLYSNSPVKNSEETDVVDKNTTKIETDYVPGALLVNFDSSSCKNSNVTPCIVPEDESIDEKYYSLNLEDGTNDSRLDPKETEEYFEVNTTLLVEVEASKKAEVAESLFSVKEDTVNVTSEITAATTPVNEDQETEITVLEKEELPSETQEVNETINVSTAPLNESLKTPEDFTADIVNELVAKVEDSCVEPLEDSAKPAEDSFIKPSFSADKVDEVTEKKDNSIVPLEDSLNPTEISTTNPNILADIVDEITEKEDNSIKLVEDSLKTTEDSIAISSITADKVDEITEKKEDNSIKPLEDSIANSSLVTDKVDEIAEKEDISIKPLEDSVKTEELPNNSLVTEDKPEIEFSKSAQETHSPSSIEYKPEVKPVEDSVKNVEELLANLVIQEKSEDETKKNLNSIETSENSEEPPQIIPSSSSVKNKSEEVITNKANQNSVEPEQPPTVPSINFETNDKKAIELTEVTHDISLDLNITVINTKDFVSESHITQDNTLDTQIQSGENTTNTVIAEKVNEATVNHELKLKMADANERLSELQQEVSNLKLQLNASQQSRASLELEVRQKEEVVIKTQAEALKTEQVFRQELKQLKEKLSEKSKIIEKGSSKDLEEALKEAKAREAQLLSQLNVRNVDDINAQKIMEEYEKTIAARVADYQKLREEHETAMRHLANLEMAFSDVHQKYERTKNIVEGFRNNEVTLRENLQMTEENLRKHEEKYESLKAHAKAQIEKSNKEILLTRDKYEEQLGQYKTLVRRLEIKCASVQTSLEQKTQECAALSALCDEVTGKKV